MGVCASQPSPHGGGLKVTVETIDRATAPAPAAVEIRTPAVETPEAFRRKRAVGRAAAAAAAAATTAAAAASEAGNCDRTDPDDAHGDRMAVGTAPFAVNTPSAAGSTTASTWRSSPRRILSCSSAAGTPSTAGLLSCEKAAGMFLPELSPPTTPTPTPGTPGAAYAAGNAASLATAANASPNPSPNASPPRSPFSTSPPVMLPFSTSPDALDTATASPGGATGHAHAHAPSPPLKSPVANPSAARLHIRSEAETFLNQWVGALSSSSAPPPGLLGLPGKVARLGLEALSSLIERFELSSKSRERKALALMFESLIERGGTPLETLEGLGLAYLREAIYSAGGGEDALKQDLAELREFCGPADEDMNEDGAGDGKGEDGAGEGKRGEQEEGTGGGGGGGIGENGESSSVGLGCGGEPLGGDPCAVPNAPHSMKTPKKQMVDYLLSPMGRGGSPNGSDACGATPKTDRSSPGWGNSPGWNDGPEMNLKHNRGLAGVLGLDDGIVVPLVLSPPSTALLVDTVGVGGAEEGEEEKDGDERKEEATERESGAPESERASCVGGDSDVGGEEEEMKGKQQQELKVASCAVGLPSVHIDFDMLNEGTEVVAEEGIEVAGVAADDGPEEGRMERGWKERTERLIRFSNEQAATAAEAAEAAAAAAAAKVDEKKESNCEADDAENTASPTTPETSKSRGGSPVAFGNASIVLSEGGTEGDGTPRSSVNGSPGTNASLYDIDDTEDEEGSDHDEEDGAASVGNEQGGGEKNMATATAATMVPVTATVPVRAVDKDVVDADKNLEMEFTALEKDLVGMSARMGTRQAATRGGEAPTGQGRSSGNAAMWSAANGGSGASIAGPSFSEAVAEHARTLGMDPADPRDAPLLYIAENSLMAPLPSGWEMCCEDGDGGTTTHPYYFNHGTGAAQWNHPSDWLFRDM